MGGLGDYSRTVFTIWYYYALTSVGEFPDDMVSHPGLGVMVVSNP
jgi:hypothetical protein